MDDISYSTLKQNGRAYEIMLLREQHNNTLADIAKKHGISLSRVGQIYNRIKVMQARLYINHISVVLGYEDTTQIMEIYYKARECYQSRSYACAYLEKRYNDILIRYRNGEPGMPIQFIRSMPPFKPKLSKKTVARIIKMRDNEKLSYIQIAEKLRITPSKAENEYKRFYHARALNTIK